MFKKYTIKKDYTNFQLQNFIENKNCERIRAGIGLITLIISFLLFWMIKDWIWKMI